MKLAFMAVATFIVLLVISSTPIASRGAINYSPVHIPATITDTLTTLSVMPRIDQTTKNIARTALLNGIANGNRPEVFAKVGDSISFFDNYLKEIGCNNEDLGAYTTYQSTIDYFRAITLPSSFTNMPCQANSFSRSSAATVGGWKSWSPLALSTDPRCIGESFLRCEYSLIQPGVALIMLGTNDVPWSDPDRTHAALTRIVTETLAAGVVPVLSTIPHRYDSIAFTNYVNTINEQIIFVANEQHVPLWNLWRAMQSPSLIDDGLSSDLVHLNSCPCGYANFTSSGMIYGSNVRSLTALQVLEKVKRVIIDDGPADLPNKNPYLPTATPVGTATPIDTATPTVVGTQVPATPTPLGCR